MYSKKDVLRILQFPVMLSGALILGGCGASEDGAETPSSNASVVATPAEESERSSTAPSVKPPAGFGNAQGRVLWNEKPAANIKVSLCNSISFMTGCGGKTYSARTDKDGNYTIDKVPPGDYGLAVQVFESETFVYPTSGVLSAAKFSIQFGETLDIRATNLYKLDLQIASPKAGETVKTGLPQLRWKPYAGAANYEVTLSSEGSGDSMQKLKTASSGIVPETPLLNGTYKWGVVASNANGIKIASTQSDTPFKVTGQSGSTQVSLVAPAPDAAVAGSSLKFSWKAHPLANGYQIYLASAKGGDALLAFEKIEGTQYALTQTLEPGTYFWSITATRDGEKVAASDLKPFRVK